MNKIRPPKEDGANLLSLIVEMIRGTLKGFYLRLPTFFLAKGHERH